MNDIICRRINIFPGSDKIKFRSTTNSDDDDDNSFSSAFIKQCAGSTDRRPITMSVPAREHTRSKKEILK